MITSISNENSTNGALALLMFGGMGISGAIISRVIPLQDEEKRKQIYTPLITLAVALLLEAGYSFWASSKLQDATEWVYLVVSVVVCLGFYIFAASAKRRSNSHIK